MIFVVSSLSEMFDEVYPNMNSPSFVTGIGGAAAASCCIVQRQMYQDMEVR